MTSHRPPWPAVVAVATALALPLLFVRQVQGEFFLPRYALLPMLALLGLPLLVGHLRRDARTAAALLCAFAIWAVVCTAASPTPAMALWGSWLWGGGLVFVLALAGAWAIGAAGGPTVAGLVTSALLIAGALNAVLALVETVVDLTSVDLGPFAGRAVGLWGNPVWLAGFLVGVFWIVAARWSPRPGLASALAVALAALLAAGIEVSGSRVALVLVGLALVLTVARAGWRPAAVLLLAVGLGLAVGAACSTVGHSDQGAVGRVTADTAGGLGGRVDGWKAAAHAVAHRPVFGEGPGRYAAAVGPHRTAALAASRGSERLFYDAHDILVEYATTMGLPGVVLLIAFLAVAIARANPLSPLGGFAVAVLATHLLEPQNPGLTPLAFLALGAAVAAGVRGTPRRGRAAAVLALPGVAIAAALLVGGWQWSGASAHHSVAAARTARSLLPRWPEVDEAVASEIVATARPGEGAAAVARARVWLVRATRDDPEDEPAWNLLAGWDSVVGRTQDARAEFARALHLNPTSVNAMNGMGALAAAAGDKAGARSWWTRSLAIDPAQPNVVAAVKTLG